MNETEKYSRIKLALNDIEKFKEIEQGLKEGSDNALTSYYEIIDGLRQAIENKNETESKDKATQRMFDDFENSKYYTGKKALAELKAISEGGIFTGYSQLDDHFQFLTCDSVLIEAKSSHGKTAVMKNLMLNILKNEENKKANPICFYITYESLRPIIWTSLCNIEAGQKVVEYDKQKKDDKGNLIPDPTNTKREGNYLIRNESQFEQAEQGLDEHFKNQRIIMPEFTHDIDKLDSIIKKYKEKFPDRTQIYFIDYVQIVTHGFKGDEDKGWQVMTKVSNYMRDSARDNKIIFIAGSQINDKGDPALTKSFYHDATVVMRAFNHGHEKVKEQDSEKYIEPINGHSVISLSLLKCRYFKTKSWPEDFCLVNGDQLIYKGKEAQSVKNFNSSKVEPLPPIS